MRRPSSSTKRTSRLLASAHRVPHPMKCAIRVQVHLRCPERTRGVHLHSRVPLWISLTSPPRPSPAATPPLPFPPNVDRERAGEQPHHSQGGDHNRGRESVINHSPTLPTDTAPSRAVEGAACPSSNSKGQDGGGGRGDRSANRRNASSSAGRARDGGREGGTGEEASPILHTRFSSTSSSSAISGREHSTMQSQGWTERRAAHQ